MTKVVVLGGTGFVGKSVMSLLKDKNINAVSFSRHQDTDILNYGHFEYKLARENPNVIINCAAHVGSLHYVTRFAADVIEDNMRMVLNLYKACAQFKNDIMIINPIANCSYPGNMDTYIESAWHNGPIHDSVLSYGSVRRMTYAVSQSYAQQYNVRSINWIIPNAYGPGDSTDPDKVHALNGIIIRMLKAKQNKDKTFKIWGTGKPLREWAYVKDIANILTSSVSDVDSQIFPINFAQNCAYSILQIAEMVADILNYKVKFTFDSSMPDGSPCKILSNDNFKVKRPFFVFTDLESGIRQTIKYYQGVIL